MRNTLGIAGQVYKFDNLMEAEKNAMQDRQVDNIVIISKNYVDFTLSMYHLNSVHFVDLYKSKYNFKNKYSYSRYWWRGRQSGQFDGRSTGSQ